MRARHMHACLAVVLVGLLGLLSASVCLAERPAKVGIYVYETLEGHHSVSSSSGTLLVGSLLPHCAQVIALDKVPLESNETVRILEEMTKDRKVVITAVSTWLTGGVLAAPTITLADDAIKFKDLTWHIDHKAVLKDAQQRGLTYALVGSAVGLARETAERAAGTGTPLVVVTIQGDFQLIDIRTDAAVWAKTYRETQAGVDARTGFDGGVLRVAKLVGDDLAKSLEQ